MKQTLTLRYTSNQQDYANVLRLFFLQRTETRVILALLVIAFGLISFTIIVKDSPPSIFELIWLLLPPFFVLFTFFVQPSRFVRQAAGNEKLLSEAVWELSDEGVQFSSQFNSTHLGWEALNKLVTTREYYLLLIKANKNVFRFLPRRAFTSSQQQDQFLELVRNHLPMR